MTRAYVKLSGGKRSIRAQGHATGSPEVCAAITCLLFSLGGYLKNTYPQGIVQWTLESGNVVLECRKTKKIDAAFTMTTIGLLQLEKRYPEHIQVVMDPA